MFYLKYRPQKLSEIDNSTVGQKLLQILQSGKIPHAFLLVGPKGTGKTSSARILSRALNCEQNHFADSQVPDVEPCNKCSTCLSILSEKSPDVIEIDGASSRKIEDVREIIESVRYQPLVAARKIFIIDEVHMLTREAFNALLKTIEEPPPYVTFILATTEKEKVPPTIVSRTSVINVSQASAADLQAMLQRIIVGENLQVDPVVLELIAKVSESSFRIAAKHLEELQIASALQNIQKAQSVLFGGEFSQIIHHIVSGDQKNTLQELHTFHQGGGNSKALIESFTTELYDHLLFLQAVRTTDTQSFAKLDQKQTLLLLKYFQKAYESIPRAIISILPLQLCMIEYFHEINTK